MEEQEHRLVVCSSFEELRRVDSWAEMLGQKFGLSETSLYGVRLCLAEAVTNIISYAYGPTGQDSEEEVRRQHHKILITCMPAEESLVISVEDDGVAFDPLQKPPPVLGESLEGVAVGGHGINLIRIFTNAVAYVRQDDRNRLTMVLTR
ncbi:MAG: ATP-binding protein [Alphaproteobacteria bacterium]